MSARNNGGPAFPVPELARDKGMSLRIYFAAQAMQAIIISSSSGGSADYVEAVVAENACKMADAMIAECVK